MKSEDISHLMSSGCSECRAIALRELELLVATSGRAVRGADLSADVYSLVESIAKWVAVNSERESIFLTPEPSWTVDVHELLDHISSVTDISKEKIGEWVDDQ